MKILFYSLALSTLFAVGCQSDAPLPAETSRRLDRFVDTWEILDLGVQHRREVRYKYNSSGNVSDYTVYNWKPNSNTLVKEHYFEFNYDGSQVRVIRGYLPGANSPYIEYNYEYHADGNISRIRENNYAAGVSSVANFYYDASHQAIRVVYTYSNGGGFEYEFEYVDGNILSDKETRGSELCRSGQYTYDNHINPFNNLGYVDYLLSNISVNNKLSENVNHIACSFPTLVPDTYSYEYDSKGYPTLAIINYNSSGNASRTRRKFFYHNY